jgi:hypothetical protein
LSKQKRKGYWSAGSGYSRYHDTALALLALEDYDAESKNRAKEWLLNEQVASGIDEGSWQGSKKDTAFLLYSIWPKEATFIPEDKVYCEDYGYYCLPSYDCDFDLRLLEYYCSGMQICCRTQPEEKIRSCNEMGGLICEADETCIGTTTSASDGICCLGACRTEEINECEDEGYTCRYDCKDDEQEVGFECPGTQICCAQKIEEKKKSKAWIFWLIFILIIITGIVIFLYKDKIREQWSKIKERRGKGKGGLSFGRFKPGRFPPGGEVPQAIRVPSVLRRPTPQIQVKPAGPIAPRTLRGSTSKRIQHDKELEETLKKLRESGR